MQQKCAKFCRLNARLNQVESITLRGVEIVRSANRRAANKQRLRDQGDQLLLASDRAAVLAFFTISSSSPRLCEPGWRER